MTGKERSFLKINSLVLASTLRKAGVFPFLKHPFLALLIFFFCEVVENSRAEIHPEAFYLEALRCSFGLDGAVDEAKTLALYKKAADLGDARALAWKARKIFHGEWGFPKDPEKAKALFLSQEEALQKMAERNCPDAKRSLAVSWGILFPKEKGKQAFEILETISHEPSVLNWGSFAWAYAHGIGVKINPAKAFVWYKKSAEGGNVNSQAEVGFCYEEGLGVRRDEKEGARWYRSAAEKNHSWAQYRLGYLHEKGIGVAKDGAEAVKWYRQASAQGGGAASLRLGVCYENGVGVEKDPGMAIAAYLKAAELGEFWAEENVGRCYANGIGTTKQPEEARKWYDQMRSKLEIESKNNVAWAWDNLGRFYFNGLGVEKDYQKALEYYRRAADLKSGWAMEQIGWCYEKGLGTEKDEKVALEWYQKAGDHGQTWSMNQAGSMYEQGRGVEKDLKKACEFYLKSAQAGNSWGQYHLGDCYYGGRGVAQDYGQAFAWFEKSADQGNEAGLGGLAACYELGQGVKKDEKKAVGLYLESANRGRSWSMGRLAQMYEDGRGTEKNPAETFRWWNRKAETGDFWAPEKVARCYAEGIGVPKNPQEAREQYRRMLTKLEEETKKNSAWGWDNLGRYYFHGMGVEKNHGKALECYRKAAELKSGWAMEQIGWCYEKGLGIPLDEKEALKWYRKAAENGQAWSMGQCAIFYESGRGTEKNLVETYRWYRKRAETGEGNRWADENVGRCHEKAIGTKKDDAEALRWYEKAAQKGSLWAGEQAGRFYEEGLGTEKNPEMAYRFYLPSVQDKRHWAQYRIVSLGSSRYYQGEYELAERCFQAAWDSGYRPAAHWLHQLHVGTLAWEKADPLKGIQIKRQSLREQAEEAEKSGALAGQALSLGYVAEARQMTEELLTSKQIQANNEQKAQWHVLAGYAALVDGPTDPLKVQGRTYPEKWLQTLESSPPVGMIVFNIKMVHPQSRVDFRHSGDFVAPIAPRRWASYLIQHIKWGVQIWREQELRGFRTLALTATGGPCKGGAFLWADFPLRNRVLAQEQFQIAETLAPNFAARLGHAVLAWQDQDADKAREVLESLQKEMAEEALAAAEKRKQKDPKSSNRVSSKRGWSLQVEKFVQEGVLPWGNVRGEVSFGFGLSSGSGLFHGQLTSAIWKLAVPFVLLLKPDWMLAAADMISQFGILSPMQLEELYTSLAEKEETRGRACARLAMIQVQLGEKKAAWEWAQRAASERPTDAEVLRMAAAIANWVGKPKDAEHWQGRFYEVQARKELLSQDSPATEYLRIFETLQEAEKLEALKKTSESDPMFRKVLEDLKRLKDNHPDWESSSIVQYRIRVLEKKLASPQQKP